MILGVAFFRGAEKIHPTMPPQRLPIAQKTMYVILEGSLCEEEASDDGTVDVYTAKLNF